MAERDDKERELALKLWVVLARAHGAVAQHARGDIGRHGLSEGEFAVLEALFHKGPLLLGEIKRKILASSGGITFLVDRLERKGLAERRRCPEDRRAIYAALTPAGEALMGRIFPEHAAAIVEAVSGLTEAEQAAAIALLRKLGLRAAASPAASSTEGSTRAVAEPAG
ncbi:MAG TPA: MarR family transcriptional regulator [Longimicrobiales bacterium]|nr:MarR family transcriptional regulator [Longimicrobiales bacterium]